jgi:hypothetical protein
MIRLIALPPARGLPDVVVAMAVDRKTLKGAGTFQTAMTGKNSTITSRQFDMPSKRAARILVPSSTCERDSSYGPTTVPPSVIQVTYICERNALLKCAPVPPDRHSGLAG